MWGSFFSGNSILYQVDKQKQQQKMPTIISSIIDREKEKPFKSYAESLLLQQVPSSKADIKQLALS